MIIEHTNNVQVIEQNGNPAFAVIPWADYQSLISKKEVWFPNEVVKANIRGDSLIKAWREYKGLTQKELAKKAGIKQPALARMEKPGANPRTSSLSKLAVALGVSIEQLID